MIDCQNETSFVQVEESGSFSLLNIDVIGGSESLIFLRERTTSFITQTNFLQSTGNSATIWADRATSLHLDECVFQFGTSGFVFAQNVTEISISNSIFEHSTNSESGGAIAIETSFEIVMTNCTFYQNKVSSESQAPLGGAISIFDGQSVLILDCRFDSNEVEFELPMAKHFERQQTIEKDEENSSVTHVEGGGLYLKHCRAIEIMNCHFQNNSAWSMDQTVMISGSSLSAIGTAQYFHIENCVFLARTSLSNGSIQGGDLAIREQSPVAEIVGCLFQPEQALFHIPFKGSHIALEDSDAVVQGCVFQNQWVPPSDAPPPAGWPCSLISSTNGTLTVVDSRFFNMTLTAGKKCAGAVIGTDQSSLFLVNSSFDQLSFFFGETVFGLVISILGPESLILSSHFTNLACRSFIFVDTKHLAFSGLLIEFNGDLFTLSDVQFQTIDVALDFPDLYNYGGTIAVWSSQLTVEGFTWFNTTFSLTGQPNEFTGAAFLLYVDQMTFHDCRFWNIEVNTTGLVGGLLSLSGLKTRPNNPGLFMTQCSFRNHRLFQSALNGWAIDSTALPVNISSCEFIDMTAVCTGNLSCDGFVINSPTTFLLTSTSLTEIVVDRVSIQSFAPYSRLIAIYGRAAIDSCFFTDSTAPNGLLNLHTSDNTTSSMTNCVFTNNQAIKGGVVLIESSASLSLLVGQLMISDTMFFNNSRAMQITGTQTTISRCSFVGNYNYAGNYQQKAAALNMVAGQASIENSYFADNQAEVGSLYCEFCRLLNVMDTVFEYNHGVTAGAVMISGGETDFLFENCQFHANSALYGGALTLMGSAGTQNIWIARSCNFTNHMSKGYQGSVWFSDNQHSQFLQCTSIDFETTLFAPWSLAQLYLFGCHFINNSEILSSIELIYPAEQQAGAPFPVTALAVSVCGNPNPQIIREPVAIVAALDSNNDPVSVQQNIPVDQNTTVFNLTVAGAYQLVGLTVGSYAPNANFSIYSAPIDPNRCQVNGDLTRLLLPCNYTVGNITIWAYDAFGNSVLSDAGYFLVRLTPLSPSDNSIVESSPSSTTNQPGVFFVQYCVSHGGTYRLEVLLNGSVVVPSATSQLLVIQPDATMSTLACDSRHLEEGSTVLCSINFTDSFGQPAPVCSQSTSQCMLLLVEGGDFSNSTALPNQVSKLQRKMMVSPSKRAHIIPTNDIFCPTESGATFSVVLSFGGSMTVSAFWNGQALKSSPITLIATPSWWRRFGFYTAGGALFIFLVLVLALVLLYRRYRQKTKTIDRVKVNFQLGQSGKLLVSWEALIDDPSIPKIPWHEISNLPATGLSPFRLSPPRDHSNTEELTMRSSPSAFFSHFRSIQSSSHHNDIDDDSQSHLFGPEGGPYEIVGTGSAATVFRGQWNDKQVAMKRVHLAGIREEDDPDLQSFRNEIKMLAGLNHPNIVKLYGISLIPSDPPEVTLILEFLERGDLGSAVLTHIPFPLALQIALDITRGCRYLHENCHPPIVHRDLKPSNVLLAADGTAKLTDFGISTFDTAHLQKTQGVGSFRYMAPEVLTSNLYSVKCDVFSFGILLVELFSGRYAFTEERFSALGVAALMTQILGGLRPEIPDELPISLKSLIGECLSHVPDVRPTFAEIEHRLIRIICKLDERVTTVVGVSPQ